MSPSRLDAPRGILSHRPGDERMVHLRLAPSAALAPFVEHFWTVRWDLRSAPPFLAETLPHPSVHLLFEQGKAQVAGVQSRRFSRTLAGQDRVFGIKFRPAGFRPFFGAPLSRLTDRVVSLRSVLGPGSERPARAILAEPDAKLCAAIAEEWLARDLPALPGAIAQLRDLVERLARDPQITRAQQAAELAGLPLRTLQRRFRDAVGVSPKWVTQRYRLHEAAARLQSPNPPPLADLALQLGYFDQSHFIRDFKAVVGRAPGDYAAVKP